MALLGGPANCPICDQFLTPNEGEGWRMVGGARPRDWLPEHCKVFHQDYLAWKRSKRLLTSVLAISTALVADFFLVYTLYVFGIRLPPNRSSGAPFVIMFFPFFFIWSFAVNRWGIRRFRGEWQERGGIPAPSIPNSTLVLQASS